MRLGDTIAIRPQRPIGSWSLTSEAGDLILSSAADVLVTGGGLPPTSALLAPREITLTLRARRSGVSLPVLRGQLLPFCRREIGLVGLQYEGLYRTLQLACSYVDGLDSLAPRFVAPDPRWVGDLSPGYSLPGPVVLLGTAAAAPSITLLGGSSGGTVSSITLTNSGYADLEFQLLFILTIAASTSVVIEVGRRTIQRLPGGSALSTLQAGSQLASFFLYPGTNDLAIVKTGTVTASLQYSARYWSWEDADRV